MPLEAEHFVESKLNRLWCFLGARWMNVRPVIFDYRSVPVFVSDMLRWRRTADPEFSVSRATRAMAGCSKALVSRVASGSRRLTRDRVDAFAALLQLTRQETRFLDQWISTSQAPRAVAAAPRVTLRRPQNHLLSDWLHVYVKDALHLPGFLPDPKVIERLLGGIASVDRIQRSLDFLFREGFFRVDSDGRVVLNDPDEVTTDEIPDARVRQFHRRALDIARRGIDLYPAESRRADAYVLALNEKNLQALKAILAESMDRVVQFRQDNAGDNERLYQVVMHLTPIGGRSDANH